MCMRIIFCNKYMLFYKTYWSVLSKMHLFDEKYSKNSYIVKYYYNLKESLFCSFFLIYCNGIAEFSASLLQSSVSHDPSEINLICWFGVQETFFLLSSTLKTIVLHNILVETVHYHPKVWGN